MREEEEPSRCAHHADTRGAPGPYGGAKIVWLNGTHGAGRTTTAHAEAARTWLHREAEVVDPTHLTPAEAARRIAEAVRS